MHAVETGVDGCSHNSARQPCSAAAFTCTGPSAASAAGVISASRIENPNTRPEVTVTTSVSYAVSPTEHGSEVASSVWNSTLDPESGTALGVPANGSVR